MTVIDLFAGPGGFDLAARGRGLEVLGVELDVDTCQTRRAAWLTTLHADVAGLAPRDVAGGATGLLGSPPCPGLSSGGLKKGREDLELVLRAIGFLGSGVDLRPHVRAVQADARSALLLEPLRWALELEPSWMVWEQVPAALPVWLACRDVLEARGWRVRVQVVEAADFGVPQTRRRAVLLARRDRVPELAYSDQRTSMADACDWDSEDLVGFPRRADRGAVINIDGGAYRARDLRRASEPAFTLTEKARSWSRITKSGRPHRVELEEAALLQTFPADMRFAGSRTSQFLQVGNAVPPRLASALLDAVLS